MNIEKSLKKILTWVSKNSDSGFNRPDLKKGLRLKNDEDVEKIFEFLKQPMAPSNALIRNVGNSGRYTINTQRYIRIKLAKETTTRDYSRIYIF